MQKVYGVTRLAQLCVDMKNLTAAIDDQACTSWSFGTIPAPIASNSTPKVPTDDDSTKKWQKQW